MTRSGLKPDDWQIDILRHRGDILGLLARQSGKTEIAAVKAITTAIVKAPCNVLYTARTLRQAAEFMRRVRLMYSSLARPIKRPWSIEPMDIEEKSSDGGWESLPDVVGGSVLQFPLSNGSRIIGIPPKEETVRGFTNVQLLIIDEAARVPDELFLASGAFLAISKGETLALTTPFGKRGFFYDLFAGSQSHLPGYKKVAVTARQVGRITEEWLVRERERIGHRWFKQEYEISFEDAVGQLIPQNDIDAAFRRGEQLKPLWSDW